MVEEGVDWHLSRVGRALAASPVSGSPATHAHALAREGETAGVRTEGWPWLMDGGRGNRKAPRSPPCACSRSVCRSVDLSVESVCGL